MRVDRSTPNALVRAARALAGAVAGLLLGLGVTLGIVVYEARFDYRFIESTDDIMNWRAAALPAGVAAGAVTGWRGPVLLAGGVAGGAAGAAVGTAAGAVVGGLVSEERSGPWAGGTIGGAIGILLGVGAGVMAAVRRRRRRRGDGEPSGVRASVALALAAAATLAGCGEGRSRELPVVPPAPAPEAEPVTAAFLFLGDPGRARSLQFPILPKIASEVEGWSERIEEDSAVVVVVLGDMIYPDGMHEPGTRGYATDSLRLESQIEMVAGPVAREQGAQLYFVAGNHDWGLMEDRRGARRLRNLGDFVDRLGARSGVAADLVPEAGTGMPYVVDVGGIRLILLDTAWWIFDAEPHRKEEMVERLAVAIAGAGNREIMIAAHHPFATAGPHGGETTVWKNLGIRRLLARSGAMLQSLDSQVYRQLNASLKTMFAQLERPLAFVGGHEHSVQVIRHDSVRAPRYSLVAGSASKLTPVGWTDGLLYRRSAPGYLRVLVRESGAVDLYVLVAPDQFLKCEGEAGEPSTDACMAEGIEAYETLFSMRLHDPEGR